MTSPSDAEDSGVYDNPPTSGVFVDPPSGWMYGFPKLKRDDDPRPFEQWLIDEGYPEKDAVWAKQYCRYWRTTEND